MPDNGSPLLEPSRCTPWNKGKLIGAKPPLRPKHVWAIRTRLMVEGRTRDLAMFNLAIDSKLRACTGLTQVSRCKHTSELEPKHLGRSSPALGFLDLQRFSVRSTRCRAFRISAPS
jgi:hypothetical protein